MIEVKEIICPECSCKFKAKTAKYVTIGGEAYPRCPNCGAIAFSRILDEEEEILGEDVAEDPLPEGGENPASVEF